MVTEEERCPLSDATYVLEIFKLVRISFARIYVLWNSRKADLRFRMLSDEY